MEESLSLRYIDEIKSTVPVRSGVFLFCVGYKALEDFSFW